MTKRIYDNFFSTSIISHVSDNDTSITLGEVPSDSEGYLVIEPNISNKREIVYFHSTNGIDTIYIAPNQRGLRGSANTGVGTEHLPGSTVEMNVTAQHMAEYDNVKDLLNKGAVSLDSNPLGVVVSGWSGLIGARDIQTPEATIILNDNKITYIEIKPNDDVNDITGVIVHTEFAVEDESNWTKGWKKLAIVKTVSGMISSIDGITDRREFGNIPNYDFIKSVSTTPLSALTTVLNPITRDVLLDITTDDDTIETVDNKLQLKNDGITKEKIKDGEIVQSIKVIGNTEIKGDVNIQGIMGINVLQTGNTITIDGGAIGVQAASSSIDYIIPTNGQTVFTLSDSVSVQKDIKVFLNGIPVVKNTDWTVSGNMLTWSGPSLDTFDVISVEWFQLYIPTLYDWIEDMITPTNGQTVFTLSNTPSDLQSVSFFINNVEYLKGNNWSILNDTITWINGSIINNTDIITVKYVTKLNI